MRARQVSRRSFLGSASAGAVAAVVAGKVPARVDAGSQAGRLAALGGTPVRSSAFPTWPPVHAELEQSLVAAFRSGRWGRTLQGAMQGDGRVAEFEQRFAKLVGSSHCLATGSCTQALHTALHAVGVAAGDEVLVSPCTFIASVQAILMCQALPVFVDVGLDTFQMDPGRIEPLVNGNTRAVEPVHIAGLPCDMPRIMAVCNRHALRVVEDAAQAPLAEIAGVPCGTFGDLGCFSFQSSKVLACGEGGAIVGRDAELIERCYTFHNLGLSSTHASTGIGTKYRMHELEAALLIPQLATLAEQIQIRHDNAAYLAQRLGEIPGIVPQKLHEGVTKGTYYLFGFRYQQEYFHDAPRDKFLKALRAERIPFTTMYFDRLNTQPFIEQTVNSPTFRSIYSQDRIRRYLDQNSCPVNDQLSAQGVWLPQNLLLGERGDIDDIADAVAKLHDQREQLAKLD